MSISFNQIPNGELIPFFYVEFDNSVANAGSVLVPWAVLIIGQLTSEGTATPLEIIPVTADGQANNLCGEGSMLSRQCEAYRSKTGRMPMYILPLEDDVTGVQRVVTIPYVGTATAAGEESVHIGGRTAKIGTALGDSSVDIASAMMEKVNAVPNCPCVATVSTGSVILTFRNAGSVANQTEVATKYYSTDKGTLGVTKSIVATTAGQTDPDFATLGIAAILGDRWYQAIATPYSDISNQGYLDDELTDRWGPVRKIGGIQFIGQNDTFANVHAYGQTLNSPFVCVVDAGNFPTPPEEIAAEVAAETAFAINIDPARPLQTLALSHTRPPMENDRLARDEPGLLLKAGISTLTIDAGSTVRIQRLLTTYKTGASGAADISYRNVNTVYTLQAIRYDLSTYFRNTFPRHKLAKAGANFGVGQAVMTTKLAKSEAIARFMLWEDAGLVEGVEQFKKSIIAEINASDPDRLDLKSMPDLMNQFRIAGVQIQYLL